MDNPQTEYPHPDNREYTVGVTITKTVVVDNCAVS
jgi:hypothetical protein